MSVLLAMDASSSYLKTDDTCVAMIEVALEWAWTKRKPYEHSCVESAHTKYSLNITDIYFTSANVEIILRCCFAT
jgi:hypothetical protein